LVRIERIRKTSVEAMTTGGNELRGTKGAPVTIAAAAVALREIQAEKEKIFVVLQFEDRGRAHGVELPEFIGMGDGRPMSKVDQRSWLADANGKTYAPALLVIRRGGCQLSFEVPSGASGLVWHDGKKKTYKLELQPVEIQELVAGSTAQTKTKP